MTKTKKPILLIIIGSPFVIAIGFVASRIEEGERAFPGWHETQNFWTGEPANTQLKALYAELRLGQSSKEIMDIWKRQRPPDLALKEGSGYSKEYWIVSTPRKWNAQNWKLYIDFDDSQNISAMKFRILDDETVRPTDAPEDVETIPVN